MNTEDDPALGSCAPSRAAAEGSVVLGVQPDGSVLASGPNPGETVYTVQGTTTLRGVTAIRVEALPDPSLPKGGPGRDPYGNFVLNGIEVVAGEARQAIKAIRADEAVGGTNFDAFFPKNLPRDAAAPRGWRIDASREEKRLPRQIVFSLDKPIETPGPLTIRLKYQGAVVGQSIGRFRVSVSSSAAPDRVVELPARLRPVLNLAETERTEQQKKDLATFYRSVAVSLKPTRDRIAALQKELRALGIPTALVMREGAGYERPSAFVRRRGNFMDKGDQVYATCPVACTPCVTIRCRIGWAWHTG